MTGGARAENKAQPVRQAKLVGCSRKGKENAEKPAGKPKGSKGKTRQQAACADGYAPLELRLVRPEPAAAPPNKTCGLEQQLRRTSLSVKQVQDEQRALYLLMGLGMPL